MRQPDQLLWVILSRILPNWREVLIIVKSETVVDGVADVGQEGRALLGGGDHELAIEGGQEALLDIAVGLIDGGDGGQAQFLGEAALEATEEPLDAPSGLGGIGRDVLDAELAKGRGRPG